MTLDLLLRGGDAEIHPPLGDAARSTVDDLTSIDRLGQDRFDGPRVPRPARRRKDPLGVERRRGAVEAAQADRCFAHIHDGRDLSFVAYAMHDAFIAAVVESEDRATYGVPLLGSQVQSLADPGARLELLLLGGNHSRRGHNEVGAVQAHKLSGLVLPEAHVDVSKLLQEASLSRGLAAGEAVQVAHDDHVELPAARHRAQCLQPRPA